ncbi:MAG: hypothetical protein ACO1PI_09345 [Bacteroidota bacterium]
MTTNKTNGNGAKEVAPATANKQANGKTVRLPDAPKELSEEEKAEQERKARLEEQRRYFDGLYRLTTMRERYEEHRQAVKNITVAPDELEQFEANRFSNLAITIEDDRNNQYAIKHPLLVKLVADFVIAHFDQKIAECEDKILNYGK